MSTETVTRRFLDGTGKNPNVYTYQQVIRLLGLTEYRGKATITFLDLMSWINDPGGDPTWGQLAREELHDEVWMSQRGPVRPDSTIACMVYDLHRGMKLLTLEEQAVIALTITGFSFADIAKVLHMRKDDVRNTLYGKPRYNDDGSKAQNDRGFDINDGGAVKRLVDGMNGRTNA